MLNPTWNYQSQSMLPTLAAPSITPDYYDDYIDFAALALQDADFAKVCGANDGKVDLQDPKALQLVSHRDALDGAY
ncbi:MAG: hypothetical protein Q9157_008633 [Trypethelium eluteriae]